MEKGFGKGITRIALAALIFGLGACTGGNAAGIPEEGLRQNYARLGERTLFPETRLDGAVMVAPEEFRAQANQLADAIRERIGIEIRVVDPDEAREKGDRIWELNLILFGSLGTNPWIDVLYGKQLTAVDGHFGPGSYLVHVVADPFGLGRNVVVAGCVDRSGAEEAVEAILARLEPGSERLPYFIDSDRKENPGRVAERALGRVEDHLEALRRSNVAEGALLTAIRDIQEIGESYAFSGSEALGEGLARLLPAFAEVVNGLGEMPPGRLHGWSPYLHPLWRLLEPSPLFDESQRAAIADCYRTLIEWDMNETYVAAFAQNYERGVLANLRRNKYMFSAFGIYQGLDYFSTHYEELPEQARWEELVETMFERAGSLMGKDDAIDYFLHVPLIFFRYGVASGDERLKEEAVRMARLQTMFVDSLGNNTSVGDNFPFGHASALYWGHSALLRAAAHFSGDPFFIGVLEKVKDNRVGLSTRDLLSPRFMFTTAMEGELPDGPATVEAFPLDEAYYDDILNPHSRMYYRNHPRAGDLNVEFDKSFFKLVWREGWDEEDQYMMLNGVNGAIHEHSDGNTINSLVDRGRIWVADRSYIEKSENFQNGLVIARDGEAAKKPYLAGLELLADLPAAAMTRTSNHGYAGADWDRTIFWGKGRYFLVVDDVLYQESGDYVTQNYWHLLGEGELREDGIIVRQKERAFALLNGEGTTMRAENRRQHAANMWGSYPFFQDDAEPNVVKLRQIRSGPRSSGDRDRFVNLMVASPDERVPEARVGLLENGLVRIDWEDGAVELAGTDGIESEGIIIDAGAFILHEETIQLAGLRHLRVGDSELRGEGNLSVEIDVASGEVRWIDGEADSNDGDLKTDFAERWVRSFDALRGSPTVSGDFSVEPVHDEVRELQATKIGEADPGVRVVRELVDGIIAVGGESGKVQVFDDAGELQWDSATESTINDLVFLPQWEDRLVVGGTDYAVRAYSLDGDEVWVRQLPPPTRSPESWVGVTSMAPARSGTGDIELLAGSAYLELYRLDQSGEIVQQMPGYHRGVNHVTAADLTGDGRDEAVVGMEWREVQVERNGRLEFNSRSVGWNWVRVRSLVVGPDRPALVVAGAADGWLEIISDERRDSWHTRLPGAIRALELVEAGDESVLYAGTGSFSLYAYSISGDELWRIRLSERVDHIFPIDSERLVAATSDGKLWLVDGGEIVGRAPVGDGPFGGLLPGGRSDQIRAVLENGEIWEITF